MVAVVAALWLVPLVLDIPGDGFAVDEPDVQVDDRGDDQADAHSAEAAVDRVQGEVAFKGFGEDGSAGEAEDGEHEEEHSSESAGDLSVLL